MRKQSRKPNKQELEQLARLMASDAHPWHNGEDLGEARDTVSGAYIAVFDNYMTDCPGYTGRIMSVIWGAPDLCEVYLWRNGQLVRVDI